MIPAETLSYVETVLQKYIDNPPVDSGFGFEGNPEDYKNPFWDMVRELKDNRYMASLPGFMAVQILDRVINDLTMLGYSSAEEAAEDLEILWDKVKLGATEGPLDAAVRMANASQLKFQTNHCGANYQKFLGIGFHLQMMRGNHYISLPVERMGEILHVDRSRAGDYIRYGRADGYLRLMERHIPHRLASKFRFTCSLVGGVWVGVAPNVQELGVSVPPILFRPHQDLKKDPAVENRQVSTHSVSYRSTEHIDHRGIGY